MNQQAFDLSSDEIELLKKFHEKAKTKIKWAAIGFAIIWIAAMTVPVKFIPKRRSRNNDVGSPDSTILEGFGITTFIIVSIIVAIIISFGIIHDTRIKKIKFDLLQKKKIKIKSIITELVCVDKEWTALIEPVNNIKRIQLGDQNYSFEAGDEVEIEIFLNSHFPIRFITSDTIIPYKS
jgi:hypothetical protein